MVMSVGFMRKLKFLVILISIGIVFGVVYVGFTLTNVEDINMVSKIYSNEQYSEAMYSGNTKERAQHLIEIEEGTWKQGCEKNNEIRGDRTFHHFHEHSLLRHYPRMILLLIKKGATVPNLANSSSIEGSGFQWVCEAAKECLKAIKTG